MTFSIRWRLTRFPRSRSARSLLAAVGVLPSTVASTRVAYGKAADAGGFGYGWAVQVCLKSRADYCPAILIHSLLVSQSVPASVRSTREASCSLEGPSHRPGPTTLLLCLQGQPTWLPSENPFQPCAPFNIFIPGHLIKQQDDT